ncbi:tyrosine-type recombinase/integrase [Microvirgula aerodenitrificans]|uniref:tyrosine-type recombinase/integrase n=1 Tax=Microvirgula aerodenitrificans TaxID=57480 RepID=UPI00248DB754|nr:tyrosine-type recombinase/integrase [Microvirgula aerodenitrificans]
MSRPPSLLPGDGRRSVVADDPRAGAQRPLLIEARDDVAAIITWLREFEDSPHTLTNYRKESRRLLLWAQDRGRELRTLRREDLLDYQRFLANPQPAAQWTGPARPQDHPDWKPFTGPLKPSSIKQALVILGAMFKYLYDAGYLDANPLALSRRKSRGVMADAPLERYFEHEVWEAVLDSLEKLPMETEREQRHYERARWLFHLLYLSGVRRSEVARATMGDIFQRNGLWWWRVLGKGNKIGDIPVSEDLLDALARYRGHLGLSPLPLPGEATPLVCRVIGRGQYTTLTPTAIYLIVKQVFLRAAALFRSHDRHLASRLEAASTHWLRHTSASHQLDAGVPLLVVSQNLRHASIQTTRKYLHSEDDARHAATQALKMRRSTDKE